MHDTRIGRFFAIDPLASKYPHNSPYAFSENRVLDGIELEGLEVFLIGGQARVSAFITGSVASGIIFDLEGNVGLYTTVSLGGGVAGGYSAGWMSGIMPWADDIYELEGWGGAVVFGGHFMGGIEVNFDMALDFNGPNSSGGLSASGGVGYDVVAAGEGTYTWIWGTTWQNIGKAISTLFEQVSWNNGNDMTNFILVMKQAKEKIESQIIDRQNNYDNADKKAKSLYQKWKTGEGGVEWEDVEKQQKIRKQNGKEIKQLRKLKNEVDKTIQELEKKIDKATEN